eukprot:746473-Hanusia_phi.AAC.1
MLQSSIPLVLLDTGVSFPSVSPPDPGLQHADFHADRLTPPPPCQDEGNAFVATLRVHGTSNRLQVWHLVSSSSGVDRPAAGSADVR